MKDNDAELESAKEGLRRLDDTYRREALDMEPAIRSSLLKPPAPPTSPSFVEAWIAYALYGARGHIPLWELIGRADLLNKTLPTAQELGWAMAQMNRRRWLDVEDPLYGLTEEARHKIETIRGDARWFDAVRKLQEWIESDQVLPHH